MAVEYFNRFNNMYPVAIAQFGLCCLANSRIHVDRVDGAAVRVLVQYTANGSEHLMHWSSQILTAMGRDEDELILSYPVKLWMVIIRFYCILHRIDYRIASHIYVRWVSSFIEKILARLRCWREIVLGDY